MKPYLQGNLDGLCGVYSLINAARLVGGPKGKRNSQRLLHACLAALKEKMDLAQAVSHGLGAYPEFCV